MQGHQSADGFRIWSNYGFVRLAAFVSQGVTVVSFAAVSTTALRLPDFLSLATAAAVTVVASNRQANVFSIFIVCRIWFFSCHKSMGDALGDQY